MLSSDLLSSSYAEVREAEKGGKKASANTTNFSTQLQDTIWTTYQNSFEHVNGFTEKVMVLAREVGFRAFQFSTWIVYAVTTSLDVFWDIVLSITSLYYLVKAKTSVVTFACDLLKLTDGPPKWEM